MIPYAIRNARGLRRLHSAHGDDGRSQAEGEDFHIYGSMSSSAAAPEWRLGFRGAGPKAQRSSVLAFERFGANRHLDGRLLAFPICDATSRFMGRERSRTDVAQFRYYDNFYFQTETKFRTSGMINKIWLLERRLAKTAILWRVDDIGRTSTPIGREVSNPANLAALRLSVAST